LTLLLVGMLTSAFSVQLVKTQPKTIIVPDNYPTIQKAINNANDGDTIFVRNGTYYENIVVNKTASLIGESRDTTIIDGNHIGTVVNITARQATVTNFTIRNSGLKSLIDSGIGLYYANNCNVTQNKIINNNIGIKLTQSSHNILSGNEIADNKDNGVYIDKSLNNLISGNNMTHNGAHGVWLESSSNNTLDRNNITINNYSGIYLLGSPNNSISRNIITTNNRYGIQLFYSSNNVLRNNILTGNKYHFEVWGSKLSDFINDVDTSNTVNGKLIYYWINKQNQTVPLDAGYLAIVNSTDIIIRNLDMKNNMEGVLLAYTKNSLISNVNATSNEFGIWVQGSSNNTITGNNLIDNDYFGIYLFDSSNNTVSGNLVERSGYYGIWLHSGSSQNNVSGNNLTKDGEYGIELSSFSNNNNISGNNITDNANGIGLSDSSSNSIGGNNIENNSIGMNLGRTSNNTIFHNSFMDNPQQVSIGPFSYANVWDNGYPSGGNYWSNYNGTDLFSGPHQNITGSDGIVDIPYEINVNNSDRYPLMNPWPLDVTPPITTISLSGVLGDNHWFTSNVTATLSSNDISGIGKVEYSFENITWITYTAPFTVTNEGSTFIYYRSTDRATPFNVETAKLETVKIDKTTPTVTITSPSPGYEIKSSTITVTWTGSDETSGISHYEIRLDTGSWINIGRNIDYTFTELDEGNHTIDLKAIDKAGNTKQDTVNFIVNRSPLFGPGYTEEAALTATIIIAIFGTAVYLLKIKKQSPKQQTKNKPLAIHNFISKQTPSPTRPPNSFTVTNNYTTDKNLFGSK